MAQAALKRILVTGGNGGIGYAMCKLLAVNHGCYVYMGSRSQERGDAALQKMIGEDANCSGKVEVVRVDVSDPASINACATVVAEKLGGDKLYALVNNAGTTESVGEGCTREQMIATNVGGVMHMTNAFVPLIDPSCGRIVNLGSGGGPSFVNKLPTEQEKAFWSSDQIGLEELDAAFKEEMAHLGAEDKWPAYCLSKAWVHKYTEIAARNHPNLMISAVSPGFVSTNLTNQSSSGISPEQGCVSSIHALFNQLGGSGWYYGSDGIRSPLHFMRNPGEPAFEGY